jgi:hypothetical protein
MQFFGLTSRFDRFILLVVFVWFNDKEDSMLMRRLFLFICLAALLTGCTPKISNQAEAVNKSYFNELIKFLDWACYSEEG